MNYLSKNRELQQEELCKEPYSNNPLKFWDKDKTFAKITLLNPNTIIQVNQMVYTHQDIQEFDKQIKELLDKGLIRNRVVHRSRTGQNWLGSKTEFDRKQGLWIGLVLHRSGLGESGTNRVNPNRIETEPMEDRFEFSCFLGFFFLCNLISNGL